MGRASSEQLTNQLIDLGYTKPALVGRKWNELNRMLKEAEDNLDDSLDDATVEVDVEPEGKEDIPFMGHERWTPYVLSLLEDNEKSNDAPRTVGLRRLTNLLVGTIIDTEPQVIQTPTPENEKRATVAVTVTVWDSASDREISSGDVADVYYGNTNDPYANHPSATATTIAEGRALKRLLGLNCFTAEELPDEHRDKLEPDSIGSVNDAQLTHLEILARDKLGLNIVKFVNKYHENCHNIYDLKHGNMLTLFQVLNSYQATSVPEELKGFESGWRNELGVR